MRKLLLICSLLFVNSVCLSAGKSKPKAKPVVVKKSTTPEKKTPTKVLSPLEKDFETAKSVYAKGDFVIASVSLYLVEQQAQTIIRSDPKNRYFAEDIRQRAKYLLATSLSQLKLPYASAFIFKDIIKEGSSNSFLKDAVSGYNKANKLASFDSTSIAEVFKGNVNNKRLFSEDSAFYHYYVGVYQFQNQEYSASYQYFKRVNQNSSYYLKSVYYLGVLNTLARRYSQAEENFKSILSIAEGKQEHEQVTEMAHMNLARMYYETNRFKESIFHYSRIQQDSDNWLVALFEASWSFFRMGQHNNALGNIHTLHSPYFKERFFPESYILQSIIYLYLCFYDESKLSLETFQGLYKPYFQEFERMINQYKDQPIRFFMLVANYHSNKQNPFPNAVQLLDVLMRTNSYKEGRDVLVGIEEERKRINQLPIMFKNSALADMIVKSLNNQASETGFRAGKQLYKELLSYHEYLKDLSEQGKLIILQSLEGKLSRIERSMVENAPPVQTERWGEGMKPLRLGVVEEYWPFKGEYWIDELGGYVYNIETICHKTSE